MKLCRGCQRLLPLTSFYHDRHQPSGITARCRDCQKRKSQAYRELHREQCRAAYRRWYQEHRESVIAQRRARYYGKKNVIVQPQPSSSQGEKRELFRVVLMSRESHRVFAQYMSHSLLEIAQAFIMAVNLHYRDMTIRIQEFHNGRWKRLSAARRHKENANI